VTGRSGSPPASPIRPQNDKHFPNANMCRALIPSLEQKGADAAFSKQVPPRFSDNDAP
jgi:hypothetical protein